MEDAAPDFALASPDDPLVQEARIERVVQLSENLRSLAEAAGVRTQTVAYPLNRANDALNDLRHGRLQGAAVLVP